jgi:hypothetical protein
VEVQFLDKEEQALLLNLLVKDKCSRWIMEEAEEVLMILEILLSDLDRLQVLQVHQVVIVEY